MLAEPRPQALVEQDHHNAVGKRDQRAPHHQRAHLVEKSEVGAAFTAERCGTMLAHQEGEREKQEIADQKAVDRLPHHHCVLADIDEKKQHQLAGEQHGRARRGNNSERQRNVEDRGEIGLEKMHHPERAEKRTDADAMACPKQRGENCEIDQRVGGEQQRVAEGTGTKSAGQAGRDLRRCETFPRARWTPKSHLQARLAVVP